MRRLETLELILATMLVAAQDDSLGDASDGPCNPSCVAICCGFSQPAKECAGCDESFECNPQARCYNGSASSPASTVLVEQIAAGDVCRPLCNTSCCGFSAPQKECAACDGFTKCHSGAECWEGAAERMRLKHERRRARRRAARLAIRRKGKSKGKGKGMGKVTGPWIDLAE